MGATLFYISYQRIIVEHNLYHREIFIDAAKKRIAYTHGTVETISFSRCHEIQTNHCFTARYQKQTALMKEEFSAA